MSSMNGAVSPELPEAFPPCTCAKCQALCQRPCWPTPGEARQLVAAGYGAQLMLAWCNVSGEQIFVLCPAMPGHQGFYAPAPEDWEVYGAERRCIIQTAEGLCRLHTAQLKPLEGRLASGCAPYAGVQVRRAIAAQWATLEGRQVVEDWRQRFGQG